MKEKQERIRAERNKKINKLNSHKSLLLNSRQTDVQRIKNRLYDLKIQALNDMENMMEGKRKMKEQILFDSYISKIKNHLLTIQKHNQIKNYFNLIKKEEENYIEDKKISIKNLEYLESCLLKNFLNTHQLHVKEIEKLKNSMIQNPGDHYNDKLKIDPKQTKSESLMIQTKAN